jgi:LacI family transcriptional regulator
MKKRTKNGPSSIKQIADALCISIGTVDRALHGRNGVSPKTRDRVLKMAMKLNYSPNLAARNLKLNRRFRIGVFLPERIALFFDPIRAGIKAAAQAGTAANIELEFHSYPSLRDGDVEALEAANWGRFDGVILAPGNPQRLDPICKSFEEENKSLVFVATDAPRIHCLSSVAIESTVSGGIAAELLGQIIPEKRAVAVITGDLKIQDHAEKLRGFAATLATFAPHLRMLPTIESHESSSDAYDATTKLLKRHPEVEGVYISTANSIPVLKAIENCHALGRIRVIATDLFPELSSLIESGQVFSSLHQRPYTQGQQAFEILVRRLVNGVVPRRSIRLAPHVVLRSNLQLFLDNFRMEQDA